MEGLIPYNCIDIYIYISSDILYYIFDICINARWIVDIGLFRVYTQNSLKTVLYFKSFQPGLWRGCPILTNILFRMVGSSITTRILIPFTTDTHLVVEGFLGKVKVLNHAIPLTLIDKRKPARVEIVE